MINKSNIGELTVEQKDFRLTIRQKEDNITQVVQAPVHSTPSYQALPQPAQSSQSSPAPGQSVEKSRPADTSTGNLITIKSPMIGTFYRRPSPDKPNLVEVGSEITPGTGDD